MSGSLRDAAFPKTVEQPDTVLSDAGLALWCRNRPYPGHQGSRQKTPAVPSALRDGGWAGESPRRGQF